MALPKFNKIKTWKLNHRKSKHIQPEVEMFPPATRTCGFPVKVGSTLSWTEWVMSAAPLIVRRGEFQISRNEVCFLNEHNYTNIISHKINIVDETLFAIYLLKFQSLLIITNIFTCNVGNQSLCKNNYTRLYGNGKCFRFTQKMHITNRNYRKNYSFLCVLFLNCMITLNISLANYSQFCCSYYCYQSTSIFLIIYLVNGLYLMNLL